MKGLTVTLTSTLKADMDTQLMLTNKHCYQMDHLLSNISHHNSGVLQRSTTAFAPLVVSNAARPLSKSMSGCSCYDPKGLTCQCSQRNFRINMMSYSVKSTQALPVDYIIQAPFQIENPISVRHIRVAMPFQAQIQTQRRPQIYAPQRTLGPRTL